MLIWVAEGSLALLAHVANVVCIIIDSLPSAMFVRVGEYFDTEWAQDRTGL